MNDEKERRARITEDRVKRGLMVLVVMMMMMGRNNSKSDWCPLLLVSDDPSSHY
jgi:hypothetical protein